MDLKKWLSFRKLKCELSKFQHENNSLKNDKSNRYCFSASDSKDTGKGGGGACILFIVSLNELNFYMNIFTGLF